MVNERIEARIEEVQGNEQGELREKLRQDCSLESLILNEFENDDFFHTIEMLKDAIERKVFQTMHTIELLYKQRLEKGVNYLAINGEIDAIRKSLAEAVDETFDDFTDKNGYQEIKNKYVERVIDRNEQERFL